MLGNNPTGHDRFIRFDELRKVCGLSRSSVWRLQQTNSFPQPKKISRRAVAWLESEVQEWLQNKTAEENKNETK